MPKQRIYVPTFIADEDFTPASVNPRAFYYNGKLEGETYYIGHLTGSTGTVYETADLSDFPYFDHYSVVSGSLPSSGSHSLLFFNETPAYGRRPNQSLYSQYWTTYIQLLYDPTTRLLRADGVIPLAEYFKLELNDVVEFRGNYYHLRAINNYNLTTGECQIELIGPIIDDTLDKYFSNKV